MLCGGVMDIPMGGVSKGMESGRRLFPCCFPWVGLLAGGIDPLDSIAGALLASPKKSKPKNLW